MQFQRANRTDAEKVFLVATNVDADSITLGYLAGYAIGGNSFDGANVVKMDSDTTANLPGFIGVAVQDIASNDSGLFQCWGFAASVYLSNTGTSVTINQGDPLVPGAGAGGATSAAPTYANGGLKYILCSNPPLTLSSTGYASGLIRCL